jgi:hexokinase
VERDLQVLGVRRWRELVTDRDKWRGTVRQRKKKKWHYASISEISFTTPFPIRNFKIKSAAFLRFTKEIKIRLKFGTAFHGSVQNLVWTAYVKI